MAGDIQDTWPVNEIVYTAIVGLVMLAALLEWFLWIAAFLYCLWKVFVKAEHWTVRVLAVLVGVAFTLFRFIFLPVMIVTLPLPSQITRIWPEAMVSFLQWFAFWTFAGLLTIPWLFCVYQIVTHQLGRTKRIKQVLDEVSAPKVVIVMPCYKEEPEVLVTAINSVVDCDYPPSCIHVFLSFDGDQEDELYLNTIEKLGVPLTLESYPKSIDVTYKAARITVSRFPHGGKRHCQKMTFKLIDKVYHDYLRSNDNLFILFIDSDCILDRVCLQNFVYDMELSPGNRRNMLAMTGVITSTTRKHSLITLLQDMEYIHGQLFERTVESGCGAVTCLPGALTMLRFSAFRRMAKYYFADKAEQCEDLFDFAKSHLGEDRWLTHLFMIGAKRRYQIQMCTSAFCKTEAVQTMRSLIKQRRRWFLGFITNEVCMLTDWRLWRRYPILVLVRFAQNTIRTTALLFFIMVLSLLTTTKRISDLPVGFIAISLGLNWLMMIYFGAKLRRFKIWLYPVMFVLNPFMNWYYMVYGIFTAGQRTWGGPRADAAAADAQTTAQEAIEQAEQTGDDLNIVPESFIPAAQERQGKEGSKTTASGGVSRSKSILLQPPDRVVGKFAAPERTPSGWYQHPDDSVASIGIGLGLGYGGKQLLRAAFHRHDSFDSTLSAQTGTLSVYLPQRVESIMGEEDRRKYELAQASQLREFMGGNNINSSRIILQGAAALPPPGHVYEVADESELPPHPGFFTDGTTTAAADPPDASASPNRPPHPRLAGTDSAATTSVSTAAASDAIVVALSSHGNRAASYFPSPLPPPPSSTSPDAFQALAPPPAPGAAPASAVVANTSSGGGRRTGRSPLGRATWTRPPTADEMEAETDGSSSSAAGGRIWQQQQMGAVTATDSGESSSPRLGGGGRRERQ